MVTGALRMSWSVGPAETGVFQAVFGQCLAQPRAERGQCGQRKASGKKTDSGDRQVAPAAVQLGLIDAAPSVEQDPGAQEQCAFHFSVSENVDGQPTDRGWLERAQCDEEHADMGDRGEGE